jgi:DNA-binding GntR family transcriptional regulator
VGGVWPQVPEVGEVLKGVPIYLQVYRILREDIVRGRLAPGERLVESRLAARLGVSRAPVREALRKLESVGLVEATGDGLRVAILSPLQVAELYACRRALERLAAGEAAAAVRREVPRWREGLQALSQAFGAEEEALRRGSLDDGVEATNAFHDAVLELAGNDCLSQLMRTLQDRIVFARRSSLASPGSQEVYHRHHQGILEAIRAGDEEAAAQRMEEHVRRAGERVTAYLAGGVGSNRR